MPGKEFLKCFLAEPDFSEVGFVGIPDEYSGRTLCKSWRGAGTPSFADGEDLYIISSNVPGVAYFTCSRTAGDVTSTMMLNPHFYGDQTEVFPHGMEDQNVTQFRIASSLIEIVPLVNEASWKGSIEIMRGHLSLSEVNAHVSGTVDGTAVRKTLVGDGVVNSISPESVRPFKEGCYCIARQTQPNYPFTPVLCEFDFSDLYHNVGQTLVTDSWGASCPGFGSIENVIIKIPAATHAGNAFTLRTWMCVEFMVNPESMMFQYSRASPEIDYLALSLAKEYSRVMPASVSYKENAGSWERFLKWVERASSELSAPLAVLDPRLGLAMRGVGAVANGLGSLTASLSK